MYIGHKIIKRLTDDKGVLLNCKGKECNQCIEKDGACYCSCDCSVIKNACEKLTEYENGENEVKENAKQYYSHKLGKGNAQDLINIILDIIPKMNNEDVFQLEDYLFRLGMELSEREYYEKK